MIRFTFAALAALVATPVVAEMTVSIPFAAAVGGKPFSCSETFAGLGSKMAEAQAVDFRLFVTKAALVKADGSLQPIAPEQDGQWQLEGLALLDFEDARGACANGTAGLDTAPRATVPEDDHAGLVFTIGVPAGTQSLVSMR